MRVPAGILTAAILGLGATGLVSCNEAGVRSNGANNFVELGMTPRDGKLVLMLNWDMQANGAGGIAPAEVGSDFFEVRAVVRQTAFPFFDNGSIGGSYDRNAVLELLPGEALPGLPGIKFVLLVTTTPKLTSRFLIQGKVYKIIFDSEGRLFDVVDGNGKSGMIEQNQ